MPKLTEGQKEILNLFNGDFEKELKTREIVEAVGGRYWRDTGGKYVGERLSRMVKVGVLERVKKGVFKLGTGKKQTIQNTIDPNQITLF